LHANNYTVIENAQLSSVTCYLARSEWLQSSVISNNTFVFVNVTAILNNVDIFGGDGVFFATAGSIVTVPAHTTSTIGLTSMHCQKCTFQLYQYASLTVSTSVLYAPQFYVASGSTLLFRESNNFYNESQCFGSGAVVLQLFVGHIDHFIQHCVSRIDYSTLSVDSWTAYERVSISKSKLINATVATIAGSSSSTVEESVFQDVTFLNYGQNTRIYNYITLTRSKIVNYGDISFVCASSSCFINDGVFENRQDATLSSGFTTISTLFANKHSLSLLGGSFPFDSGFSQEGSCTCEGALGFYSTASFAPGSSTTTAGSSSNCSATFHNDVLLAGTFGIDLFFDYANVKTIGRLHSEGDIHLLSSNFEVWEDVSVKSNFSLMGISTLSCHNYSFIGSDGLLFVSGSNIHVHGCNVSVTHQLVVVSTGNFEVDSSDFLLASSATGTLTTSSVVCTGTSPSFVNYGHLTIQSSVLRSCLANENDGVVSFKDSNTLRNCTNSGTWAIEGTLITYNCRLVSSSFVRGSGSLVSNGDYVAGVLNCTQFVLEGNMFCISTALYIKNLVWHVGDLY